jgi:hypothetical protein
MRLHAIFSFFQELGNVRTLCGEWFPGTHRGVQSFDNSTHPSADRSRGTLSSLVTYNKEDNFVGLSASMETSGERSFRVELAWRSQRTRGVRCDRCAFEFDSTRCSTGRKNLLIIIYDCLDVNVYKREPLEPRELTTKNRSSDVRVQAVRLLLKNGKMTAKVLIMLSTDSPSRSTQSFDLRSIWGPHREIGWTWRGVACGTVPCW